MALLLRSAVLLLSCVLAAVPLTAQSLSGRLDPGLHVDARTSSPAILDSLSSADARALGVDSGSTDKLFSGDLTLPRNEGLRYKAVVVERQDGTDVLYLDRNRDGRFEASERLAFRTAPPDDPRLKSIVTTDIDLPGAPFRTSPIQVSLVRGKAPFPLRPDQIAVVYTAAVFVQGNAQFPDRKVAFRFQYDPQRQAVLLNDGILWVDLNGDGVFDMTSNGEFLHAHGTPPVFSIGSRTYQVSSVDVEHKSFTLKPVSAQDTRIPLIVGAQLPDFTYRDFSGAQHHVSDLKGRYLLLDFWATWCAPCMAELPALKESYATWHPRGLEILAIDGDESPDKPRAVIAQQALLWPQAQYDADLLHNRFQIAVWPTLALVDLSNGRRTIVSVGASEHLPLDADHIKATLGSVLGP